MEARIYGTDEMGRRYLCLKNFTGQFDVFYLLGKPLHKSPEEIAADEAAIAEYEGYFGASDGA